MWVDTELKAFQMSAELTLASFLAAVVLTITSVAESRQALARLSVCGSMIVLFLVYIAWRTEMLGSNFTGTAESIWQYCFFAAEAVCAVEAVIFYVQMSRIRENGNAADAHEKVLRQAPLDQLPNVDVWIATYNEEWSILEKTIVGALHLEYPRDKLRILVLDDGRRDWLRERCFALGVEHVTRLDNKGKKAGNHNNALGLCSAPFILSLDADFIPFPQFLYRTLGFFDDPLVAVVQTPQTFYNVDVIRRNLSLKQAPDELAFFYREEQPARDAWDSAFYCGSCAVLRRSALLNVGGFVTSTAVEDLPTSVKLCAHGYKARYLNETLSVGLSAESAAVLHDQRNRWCRGSLQLLFTSFGPFGSGLTLMQRLLFRQSQWIVWSVLPILFFIAPSMLWLFGWRVYNVTGTVEISLMPFILFGASALALMWLTRMHWHPLLSPATQLFLAWEVIPTALTTLMKPFGRPLVRILPVTPKGTLAGSTRVDMRTFLPLFCVVALTLTSFMYSLLFSKVPLYSQFEIAAAVVWTLYSLVVGSLACLMCFEISYQGPQERFEVDQRVVALTDGALFPVRLHTISLDRAGISGQGLRGLQGGQEITLDIATIGRLHAQICNVDVDTAEAELRWLTADDTVRHRLIRAIYANALVQRQVEEFDASATTAGVVRRFSGAA